MTTMAVGRWEWVMGAVATTMKIVTLHQPVSDASITNPKRFEWAVHSGVAVVGSELYLTPTQPPRDRLPFQDIRPPRTHPPAEMVVPIPFPRGLPLPHRLPPSDHPGVNSVVVVVVADEFGTYPDF